MYVHKSTDKKGCCCHDRMVVGFTATCAISAYHHKSCEFVPRSWCEVYSIQHVVENGIKHHDPSKPINSLVNLEHYQSI